MMTMQVHAEVPAQVFEFESRHIRPAQQLAAEVHGCPLLAHPLA
jgi:hypothetical protein